MALATYSPEDVVILLGGVYPLDGVVAGTFIEVSRESSTFETSVTADGRVSRTHISDPTHNVTISLASTADSNSILSTLSSTDNLLQSVIVPLFVKDGLGGTMFYAPSCWIEKIPSVSFSEGVEVREWTIKTAGGVLSVGGNEKGSSVSTDLAALGFIAADFGGLFR